MELQDYWRTVRRRWRLVLGSVLVVLAVAGVWTWSVTPLYSSTTRLFVSTSQTDESSAYTGNLFATQRVTSYADLVTSRALADKVSDALGDGYAEAWYLPAAANLPALPGRSHAHPLGPALLV